MKRNKLLLLVSLFFLNVTLYSATESVKLIRQNQTISAVTRAGNVVTVTLSSNFPNDNLKAGQKIVIKNVTPTSFNGTFTIASVASQTSFTYNQTAIDASGSGGTAGGDYTSLVTWEDTEKGDLVFLNQIAVAECYDDWTGNGMDIGTGYFTISRDWGTSASCYVKIYVPPNERRAAANPLRYRGGTTARGFGITGADSASYEGLIRTYANYIKFEGLQVWCKATPYNISALSISEVTGSSNKIEITDCVLAGACGRALAVSCAPGIGVPKVYVRNTLMYTSFSGDHYSLLITNDVASGTECYLYNCVIGNGFACARIGTAIAKNTYAARWYPSPDSIFTGNNNAGGTAVVPGGGTLTDLDGGNLFVDITSGAEDFHLREYSPLADAGVDLSANAIMPFSNDIDGQTRSGSWDIGCDEYGATQSVPTITTTNLANGGVGSVYSATLTATGGTAPYSWTNTTALPAGLTLSAAGAISGTPTAVGSTTTTFKVTDSLSAVATKDLCITVQAATSPKYKITGNVKDTITSVVIPGATVMTTGVSTTTSASGYYEIPNLSPGTYQVCAVASGYQSSTITVTIVSGNITGRTISLTPVSTGNGDADVDVIIAVPAPNPGTVEDKVTFMKLPSDKEITISIYTIAGNKVLEKNLGVCGTGNWLWDCLNKDGNKISSGLYTYVINAGGAIKKGKIAIK